MLWICRKKPGNSLVEWGWKHLTGSSQSLRKQKKWDSSFSCGQVLGHNKLLPYLPPLLTEPSSTDQAAAMKVWNLLILVYEGLTNFNIGSPSYIPGVLTQANKDEAEKGYTLIEPFLFYYRLPPLARLSSPYSSTCTQRYDILKDSFSFLLHRRHHPSK